MPTPKTKSTFATCALDHVSPSRENISSKTKVLNAVISYNEALKLQMVLQAALLHLSRYNFSTKEGKRAAVTLAVHVDRGRVSLHESSTL